MRYICNSHNFLVVILLAKFSSSAGSRRQRRRRLRPHQPFARSSSYQARARCKLFITLEKWRGPPPPRPLLEPTPWPILDPGNGAAPVGTSAVPPAVLKTFPRPAQDRSRRSIPSHQIDPTSVWILITDVLMPKPSARQCGVGASSILPSGNNPRCHKSACEKCIGRLRQADAAVRPNELPDPRARAWQPSSRGQRGNSLSFFA